MDCIWKQMAEFMESSTGVPDAGVDTFKRGGAPHRISREACSLGQPGLSALDGSIGIFYIHVNGLRSRISLNSPGKCDLISVRSFCGNRAAYVTVQIGLRVYRADRTKTWWLRAYGPSRSDFKWLYAVTVQGLSELLPAYPTRLKKKQKALDKWKSMVYNKKS